MNSAAPNMGNDHLQRPRVLLMEDENSVAQALQIILADEGYGVNRTATGQGALASMSREDFDLLVADLRLPDMSGMDVIRRIKRSQPETEVIVITGYASVGSAVEAMKTGAVDYLPKPFTDDQFKAAVQKALKEKAWRGPGDSAVSGRKRKLIGKKEVVRALRKVPPEFSESISGEDRGQDRVLLGRESKGGAGAPVEGQRLGETILECANEGVVATDRKGTIVYVNESLEAMLGYSRNELYHTIPLARLLPFGEMERLRERLESDEWGGKNRLRFFETQMLDKGGNAIPVQISSVLLSEKEELGVVAFVRNMKEVRKAEQEDADPSRLLQQDKMMSLGRLAASVVHEINNPLAGILNYLRLMIKILSRGGTTEEQVEKFRKYLSVVEKETDRCSRIVSNLLAFSRKSKMEYAQMGVNELLERSIMLSQHKMTLQNIQIKTDLDPELPNIQGDFNQLQQCVINLIFNAIDAMPQGGVLTVSSSFQPKEGMVQIRVADTGCGIAEENLPSIFDPFFTTKTEGKGLGLGLSTVSGIVERHKGTIQVESRVGKGTAFTISLPTNLSKS